ncbi:MAG: HIT domain-containing protein [Acidobacteria bacterium]|nr:HIT domain-containing protein [Acidobacteriota bacterium]MBV9184850.1 HIT domain-containing protein [Acidobacteriota bacterium]
MSCVFCNEPRSAGEVLFEDDRVLVILHEDWAVRGHAMVVWKAHIENVADLTIDEYAHFAAAHHRAERALLDATGADRAILLKLGIATPHLHLHVYPVSASLDRAAVMEIIDGRVRDAFDQALIDELRERLA